MRQHIKQRQVRLVASQIGCVTDVRTNKHPSSYLHDEGCLFRTKAHHYTTTASAYIIM
jgi:hypothetical protein